MHGELIPKYRGATGDKKREFMIIKEFKDNSPIVKSNFHNVNKIIDRAKVALGVTLDIDFARKIGILPSTLTNWRKRGTINYPLLMSKCQNTSLDWLLIGKGEKRPVADIHQEQDSDDPENPRIACLENQIRELYTLYHEKLEQSPLTDRMVEIPLFIDQVPDQEHDDPGHFERYLAVSREFIRDKNTSFALRILEKDMAGEGLRQNDLLIVDTGLMLKDNCLAIVIHQGKQSLKKLFLREGKLFIAGDGTHEMTPVSLGNSVKVLGIVNKVIRDVY